MQVTDTKNIMSKMIVRYEIISKALQSFIMYPVSSVMFRDSKICIIHEVTGIPSSLLISFPVIPTLVRTVAHRKCMKRTALYAFSDL